MRMIVQFLMAAIFAAMTIGHAELTRDDFVQQIQSDIVKYNANWEDVNKFPNISLTNKQINWLNSLAKGKTGSPSTRKEIRLMNTLELRQFMLALRYMKLTKPDRTSHLSQYDILVSIKRKSMAPSAHKGAATMAFNREYLYRFETALKSHIRSAILPYWDPVPDSYLTDPSDSAIWISEYFGTKNGAVTEGFAKQTTPIRECSTNGETYISRNVVTGATGRNYLMTADKVDSFMQIKTYKDMVCKSRIETDNGLMKMFIGGTNDTISCSMNDPLSYLIDVFFDEIWEEQKRHYTDSSFPVSAPDCAGKSLGLPEHAAGSPMLPFTNIKNSDGLRNVYKRHCYHYSARPSSIKCHQDNDCLSLLLWCDSVDHKCKARIQTGGKCDPYPSNACYGCNNAVCSLGVCSCSDASAPKINRNQPAPTYTVTTEQTKPQINTHHGKPPVLHNKVKHVVRHTQARPAVHRTQGIPAAKHTHIKHVVLHTQIRPIVHKPTNKLKAAFQHAKPKLHIRPIVPRIESPGPVEPVETVRVAQAPLGGRGVSGQTFIKTTVNRLFNTRSHPNRNFDRVVHGDDDAGEDDDDEDDDQEDVDEDEDDTKKATKRHRHTWRNHWRDIRATDCRSAKTLNQRKRKCMKNLKRRKTKEE